MQKTEKPQPKSLPNKYVPEDHSKDDYDFFWELFKLVLISGLPVLILFYSVEVFIPFVQNAERYDKKCLEKGGIVYTANHEIICLKKDAIIKIE